MVLFSPWHDMQQINQFPNWDSVVKYLTKYEQGYFMKISTILEKIDESQLFVPAFQRE